MSLSFKGLPVIWLVNEYCSEILKFIFGPVFCCHIRKQLYTFYYHILWRCICVADLLHFALTLYWCILSPFLFFYQDLFAPTPDCAAVSSQLDLFSMQPIESSTCLFSTVSASAVTSSSSIIPPSAVPTIDLFSGKCLLCAPVWKHLSEILYDV